MTRDFLLSYLLSSLEKVALETRAVEIVCYLTIGIYILQLRVSQQDDQFFRENDQRERAQCILRH